MDRGGKGIRWREKDWARLRSGGQESTSGRATQEGKKTSDSMPNRNQARLIDIRLGGEGRAGVCPPQVPSHPPPCLLLLPVFHCMS